jgi:hypothetical protein
MRLFWRTAVALGCVGAVVGCTSAGPAAVGYAGTTAITNSAGCPAPAPGTSPGDRKTAAQLQARVRAISGERARRRYGPAEAAARQA